VARIEDRPVLRAEVQRGELRFSAPATALSVMAGAVAVGTPLGLFKGSTSKLELTLVNVTAGPNEPPVTGAVKLLARRREGGLFVWSDAGLFHDDRGRLLLSPLSAGLSGADLRTLDAFGAGASEELWLVNGGALEHVGGGTLTRVDIAGIDDVDLAVGVEAGQALAAAQGSLYLVDITRPEALRVTSGLGAVNAFARDDDGTVYLATDVGLLVRSDAGDFSLHLLDGDAGSGVDAVAAGFGTALLASNGQTLLFSPDAWIVSADTTSRTLAVDANGDGWLADGEKLIQLKTGAPVSFALDVRPFFAAHCNSCHSSGASAAPIIHWNDYETARQYGPAALRRLEANGTPPMPPSNVEVLTPQDFAVVARWVHGGMPP
jgi:cytochrome c5